MSDFEIDANGTLVKYTGNGGDVVIPDGVMYVGRVFSDPSRIVNVIIPDSVTSIGEGAFSGCESLTSITIPDSVTSIGDHAFDGCSSLTSIIIPEGVSNIGKKTFSDCRSLMSIRISNTVRTIEKCAFECCSSLKEVSIPESVTKIEGGAFADSGLQNVAIPNSVNYIGKCAFYGCQLTEIIIPDSVNFIGDEAFYKCKQLVSVSIPDCCHIGEYVFGCDGSSSREDDFVYDDICRGFENSKRWYLLKKIQITSHSDEMPPRFLKIFKNELLNGAELFLNERHIHVCTQKNITIPNKMMGWAEKGEEFIGLEKISVTSVGSETEVDPDIIMKFSKNIVDDGAVLYLNGKKVLMNYRLHDDGLYLNGIKVR